MGADPLGGGRVGQDGHETTDTLAVQTQILGVALGAEELQAAGGEEAGRKGVAIEVPGGETLTT